MGDADELGYDDDVAQQHDPFLTPEARAFTGAGLVLASMLGGGVFQFLSFPSPMATRRGGSSS